MVRTGSFGVGLVLVLVVGCVGDEPSLLSDGYEVVYGSAVAQGADEDVVALMGGGGFCSGVVVASRLVATAGHCVDAVQFDGTAVFGNSVSSGGDSVPIVTTVSHPSMDIALVELAWQAPVLPRPIRASGLSPGEQTRVVGFGRTETDNAGVKMTAYGTVADVAGGEFLISAIDGSSCHGDSGGPYLTRFGGVEYFTGVVSRGPPDCVSGESVAVQAGMLFDVVRSGGITDAASAAELEESLRAGGGAADAAGGMFAGEQVVVGGCHAGGAGAAGNSMLLLAVAAIQFVCGRRRRRAGDLC